MCLPEQLPPFDQKKRRFVSGLPKSLRHNTGHLYLFAFVVAVLFVAVVLYVYA